MEFKPQFRVPSLCAAENPGAGFSLEKVQGVVPGMIPIGRIEGISPEHKAQPWTVGIPSWELFLEIPIRGFPSSCRAQSWLLLCSFLFPGVGTGSCSVHSFFRVSRLSSSPTPHPIHPSRDEKTQNVSTPPIFLRPMWEFSQGSEFIGKF